MRKVWAVAVVVWTVLGSGLAQTGTPASPSKALLLTKPCDVISAAPTPAETAMNKKEYSSAEGLYRAALEKHSSDEVSHEGLVRALIAQDKVDDAAREAEAWIAASPASSMAMTALGDARLRQGAPREGLQQFVKAEQADSCNARAVFGISRIAALGGSRATAKQAIEQAYALHPSDEDIHKAWIATRLPKQRMEEMAAYAEHSNQISDEDRARLKARLEKSSVYHASDCRAAAVPLQGATVPMAALQDGPRRFIGWGLDVQLNGNRRRLQIDTGASGITLSRAAAVSLGLQREDATLLGGIGDEGKVETSITHVASVKIGGLEFTNCTVEILEKRSALGTDGLIGADVFGRYLVTLDFPKHELKLAALPRIPAEKTGIASLSAEGDEAEVHDPYIAPEMARWEKIYRSGHELLVPTAIVDTKRVQDRSAWKEKLFMLDTGAYANFISPKAAAEVSSVARDYWVGVRGVNGAVDKVYQAGMFTMAFAGLRVNSSSTTSIDTTSLSHDAGLEISGLIGAEALFQVVMHIDYRDYLVWCEYTPQR